MKLPKLAYQQRAIRWGCDNACGGFFIRPGRGKTAIGLSLALELKKRRIRRTLIVAPFRVCRSVWPAELEKWEDFRRLRLVFLHGPKKAALLEEGLRTETDLFLINPEGLGWLISEIVKLDDFPFDMLIVDESSKFKDSRTQRFKLLSGMLEFFRRRYIMTGSPRPNHLTDLFGQMYIVDQGATLGPYFTRFANRYFLKYEYELFPKPGAEKEIYRQIAPHAFIVPEDDKSLPQRTDVRIEIELPPKARAIYDQMESELVVMFKRGKVTAANAAVMSMKCRQIAAGAVYLDTTRKVQITHKEKLEALLDLLEGLEGGVSALIAYNFDHERDWLRAELNAPYLGGGVSGNKGDELVQRWNRGELPHLLVHPKSASHGLNMQEVRSDVVWYSPTWSYDEYDQLNRRVWRKGRKTPVTVHHIIARDTTDEVAWNAVHSKEEGQNRFFVALLQYWERRGFIGL